MPPQEREPDPNYFFGKDLTSQKLTSRMGEVTGRALKFPPSAAKRFDSEYIPMTDFARHAPRLTERKVLDMVGTMMVGKRFREVLQDANGIVVCTPEGRSTPESLAVLKTGWEYREVDGKYSHEPVLDVDGFGVRDPEQNGFALNTLASQILVTADAIRGKLDHLMGSLRSPKYTMAVRMLAGYNMRPTLPAERINTDLARCMTELHSVAMGEPRMGTGFGDRLHTCIAALEKLGQEHPNHPVVQSLLAIPDFGRLKMGLTMGGDETLYRQAHKLCAAATTLLSAVSTSLREHFEQVHPEHCEEPAEITVEYSGIDGSFSVEGMANEFPIGSANFTVASKTDTNPKIGLDLYDQDGTAELMGAVVKHATNGPWWNEQLRV